MSVPQVGELAAGFAQFIEAANRLEVSHSELQQEVYRLRRELEERNRELERSLEIAETTRRSLYSIVHALPCGVVLTKAGSRGITLANPEAKRLLNLQGYASDLLPQEIIDLCGRMEAAEGGEEEIRIKVGGQARWLTVRSVRVSFFQNPGQDYQLLILRDITARKAFEMERDRARNSIALGEMSSILAHEIRNPLAHMELFATLLADEGALSEEAQGWVRHIASGVRTLGAIVNNVLRLYTTGALDRLAFDLEGLLRDCVQLLQPAARERVIELCLQLDGSPLKVRGDSQGLRQVVMNLANNALKHTPEGGTVMVTASNDGSNVRVEVSDAGSGIAPEHLPHIFEVGFSASGKSSGLGLAVCKRIVEAHAGKLGVGYTGQRGTAMYLEIPAL